MNDLRHLRRARLIPFRGRVPHLWRVFADSGSGGVLACAIAAAIIAVSLVALSLFSAIPERARVQAAADSAAIAAAESLLVDASRDSCDLASQTAEVNGAALTDCVLTRNEATVTVQRVILGITVSITARAGIDTGPADAGGAANGAIPLQSLTLVEFPGVRTSPGVYLRADAASALLALLEAYHRDTGDYLPVDEGYRDLVAQQEAFNHYGWPRAAIPGTSNHGVGIAIDFVNPPVVRGGSSHDWLVANAAGFGFEPLTDPDEPWHWDYSGLQLNLRPAGPR